MPLIMYKNAFKAEINVLRYTGLNNAIKQTLIHLQNIKPRMQSMEYGPIF